MILKNAIDKLFKIREDAARSRPGADSGYDPYEKPFLDHLEDLRETLLRMGATLAICTVISFVFNKQLFNLLLIPAKRADLEDGSTLFDKIDFFVLAPQDIILLALKAAFFAALVVSIPLLVYFAFQFLLPGLRQIEKKMIIPGAGVGFVLFLTGASFAFLWASPLALSFFYEFENKRIGDINPAAAALKKPIAEMPLIGVGGKKIPPVNEPVKKKAKKDAVVDPIPSYEAILSREEKQAIRGYMIDLLAVQEGKNFVLRYDESRDKIILAHSKGGSVAYQIGKYFEFITRLTLVFGLSFQMPIIVTILVKLELLTARVMRSTRTYAWIAIMVASAILTPPDLITLALLAGPMIILYEICVIIASVLERKQKKKEQAEEKAYRARMAELYEKSPSDLNEQEKTELHKHEIKEYEQNHADLYEDNHDYDNDNHDEEERIGYKPEDYYGDNHFDEAEDHGEQVDDDDHEEHKECEPSGDIIDMNKATVEELMQLPQMDEWLIEMVVEHRPYNSFEELGDMIGEEYLELWMERIKI